MACKFSSDRAQDLLAQGRDTGAINVACSNSLSECTIAGPLDQLKAFGDQCLSAGEKTMLLDVPYGFHSAAMDPILIPLKQVENNIRYSPPKIPVASNVHGRLLTAADLQPGYFADHARNCVRFVDAIQELESNGLFNGATFLEIGPHPIAISMIKRTVSDTTCSYLPSLRNDSNAWSSLTSSLSRLASLHESINWRTVFGGAEAQLVDLPGHPLSGEEHCVPYQESYRKYDLQRLKHSLTDVTGYAFLSRAIVPTKPGFSHAFETPLSSLATFIDGHKVGGKAICPASIFHELVLEAAQISQGLPKQTCYVVKEMTINNPLIHHSASEDDVVRVSLQESSGNCTQVNIVSISNSRDETFHCSALLTTNEMSTIRKEWARVRALITRQKHSIFSHHHSALNIFRTRMLYDTVFSRVVSYSEDYRTLSSLSVSTSNDEALGTFCLRKPIQLQGCVVQPTFVDTLLHAAGFVANSSVAITDVCICNKVDSVVVLYDDIDYNGSFTVYTTLFMTESDMITADSYVHDHAENVVAAVEGMHFKKLRLATFETLLDRSLMTARKRLPPSPSDISLSSHEEKIFSAKGTDTPVTPPSSESDVLARALHLVATVCHLNESKILAGGDFYALGIDSLMLLEIYSAFSKALPDCSFDQGALMHCRRWADLEQLLLISYDNTHSRRRGVNPSMSRASGMDLNIAGKSRVLADPIEITKSQVCGLIGSVCGISDSQIALDQDLDSLGIDSLLSIELEESLKRKLGLSITGEEISNCRSVANLLNLAVCAQPDSQSPVTLNGDGPNSEVLEVVKQSPRIALQFSANVTNPLYLFHDGSGHCSMYSRLLNMDRNLYGFASIKLLESGEKKRDLSDLAAHYVTDILASETSELILGGASKSLYSPFLPTFVLSETHCDPELTFFATAGWSFGGILALEAAHQLQKSGKRVLGIILIDSPFPVEHTPLPESIISHVVRSVSKSVKTTIQGSPAQEVDTHVAKSGSKARKSTAQDHLAKNFRLHAAMLSNYRPHLSVLPDTKIVALRSKETLDCEGVCGVNYPWLSDQAVRSSAIDAWGKLVGQPLEVLEIPGNHFEPFLPRNVNVLSPFFCCIL